MNHKDSYRLLIRTWNTADFSRTPEWLKEDYVSHYGLADQPISGSPREAFMAGVIWFRSMSPDFEFRIKFMVEEGDMLIGHWEGEGTQEGDFLGIPATGKRFVLRGVDMLRFEGDMVAEVWHIEDFFGAVRQLQS
jgi:predicted ester cyclase